VAHVASATASGCSIRHMASIVKALT